MRLLIHGGAGTIPRDGLEAEVREALSVAVLRGYAVLRSGGSALDAVAEAVVSMEDCPLFNAGRGSVLNHQGRVEMDAAIMCGATSAAGAVACVTKIRNPVRGARAVMEENSHVLLVGAGAESFAAERGCEMALEDWFVMPEQVERWKAMQGGGQVELDHAGASGPNSLEHKFGTVGAVAIDCDGNLAAATSTGGTRNKHAGRVGDTPLIGAGTYASNASVAVSFTGIGEFVMRTVAGHSLAALVEIGGLSLQDASDRVLAALTRIGGRAGLIAIDRRGNFALSMNTEGMLRGWVGDDGQVYTSIYA
jgi:beta-aspartyl-peptidase (threonine type)